MADLPYSILGPNGVQTQRGQATELYGQGGVPQQSTTPANTAGTPGIGQASQYIPTNNVLSTTQAQSYTPQARNPSNGVSNMGGIGGIGVINPGGNVGVTPTQQPTQPPQPGGGAGTTLQDTWKPDPGVQYNYSAAAAPVAFFGEYAISDDYMKKNLSGEAYNSLKNTNVSNDTFIQSIGHTKGEFLGGLSKISDVYKPGDNALSQDYWHNMMDNSSSNQRIQQFEGQLNLQDSQAVFGPGSADTMLSFGMTKNQYVRQLNDLSWGDAPINNPPVLPNQQSQFDFGANLNIAHPDTILKSVSSNVPSLNSSDWGIINSDSYGPNSMLSNGLSKANEISFLNDSSWGNQPINNPPSLSNISASDFSGLSNINLTVNSSSKQNKQSGPTEYEQEMAILYMQHQGVPVVDIFQQRRESQPGYDRRNNPVFPDFDVMPNISGIDLTSFRDYRPKQNPSTGVWPDIATNINLWW